MKLKQYVINISRFDKNILTQLLFIPKNSLSHEIFLHYRPKTKVFVRTGGWNWSFLRYFDPKFSWMPTQHFSTQQFLVFMTDNILLQWDSSIWKGTNRKEVGGLWNQNNGVARKEVNDSVSGHPALQTVSFFGGIKMCFTYYTHLMDKIEYQKDKFCYSILNYLTFYF